MIRRLFSGSFQWNRCFSLSATLREQKSLVGRDLIDPNLMSIDDWKQIMWTAMDLKELMKQQQKSSLDILKGKHVTLLFVKPSTRVQVSYSFACHLLGAGCTEFIDPDYESQPDCTDSGRALSRLTDVVIVNGIQQSNLAKIADGCRSPVIGACTNLFSIHKALSDTMAILEKYKYLKGITVAWIGPPTSLCNTYLSILPAFGINIRVCCMSSGTGRMTPVKMQDAIVAGRSSASELHECETADEAIYRAHVIATSMHPEERYQITHKNVCEADLDWSLLHSLPRSPTEVTDSVFLSKNNITWNSSENFLYIAMALIVTTLCPYQPRSKRPDFEGCEQELPKLPPR